MTVRLTWQQGHEVLFDIHAFNSRVVILQCFYLHAYESVSAAKAGIGKYFAFYNARRSHTGLERKTPDNVYFKSITPLPLAAAA